MTDPNLLGMSCNPRSVMVTGGAGYVGSALVPKLLEAGHRVSVLDLYLYGDDVLADVRSNKRLREIKGDLRDAGVVADALQGCDTVIHLACISNDPSYDLDPDLGRSINYDAFLPLVRASKNAGVELFVFASSSSVYGIKDELNVTENLPLEPLTDYSKFKAKCEETLENEREKGFSTCIIRPSTVCGYSPRTRLDVIVNILTNHAVNTGRIKVFGGSQKRPNIHIDDMVDVYKFLLDQPRERIDGGVYNVGYENHTLMELANMVRSVVGNDLEIDILPTDDLRSYHVSSEKIRMELGFIPQKSIIQAIEGLVAQFKAGKLSNSMEDPKYFNITMMKSADMK